MPKAYWIAHVTVKDPEAYTGYQRLAPAAFEKFGARFLARGGESDCCEGTRYERHVVIEFDSLEKARACYSSKEYQNAKANRDGACNAHVTLVEGL
ncbi:DUF1330 domain-containing protein [Ruegeria lacuscaerulensis]|uniref:DUF1330 domain-containing protein n=1 Tax=Ruegeria lacuscaerulensis TaxID=55218 RepID=UPI00147D140B|nr:DUF1330 domain-containing protein [Ruegeria lacuscaerulensis]